MKHQNTESSSFEQTPSVEDVIMTVATFCDGAKRRDNSGFSKADAGSGARLATMAKNNIPWGAKDLEYANSLISGYANQISKIYYPSDKSKAQRFSKKLKEGKLSVRGRTVSRSPWFNYMYLSDWGRYIYIRLERMPKNYQDFVSELKQANDLLHGKRKVSVKFLKNHQAAVNGQTRKFPIWKIDANSTSKKFLKDFAKKWNIRPDISLFRSEDVDLDNLLRHTNFCYQHEGRRNKRFGQWCVFDLHYKNNEFIYYVKNNLKGHYDCQQKYDYNWFVFINDNTIPHIKWLIKNHNFVISKQISKTLNIN